VTLSHSVIAIVGVVTAQVLAACSLASGHGAESHFEVAGHSAHRLAGTGATQVGVYQDEAGTCFGYTGSNSSGGYCMRAVGNRGWALEVKLITAGDSPVLLVAGDDRTTVVRVPRSGQAPLVVRLDRYPGISAPVGAVPVDPTKISLVGNVVAGYDAQGSLLGHTHDCEGLGGPKDCGPYTGLLDRNMQRPHA